MIVEYKTKVPYTQEVKSFQTIKEMMRDDYYLELAFELNWKQVYIKDLWEWYYMEYWNRSETDISQTRVIDLLELLREKDMTTEEIIDYL